MDTRGCYVYRYRNMYFAYHRLYDSYPEGLGVEMVQCMRLPLAITKKQQELEEILDWLDYQSFPQSFDDLTIFDQRSRSDMDYDIDAEFFYEIDLDHNIFRVNGIPFYSLECLPEPEDFPEHVSKDHYYNLACAPGCPPKHKYKRPAAPVVDDSKLETYQSLACTGPRAALTDLLGIPDISSTVEQVRVSLLEMLIGQCMIEEIVQVGKLICEFEFISNDNQLTDDEWSTAYSLVNIAFAPQIFDVHSVFIDPPKMSRKEFTWVREDIVVCLATHLDDERCLQASVSRLIESILEERDAPGDYFGVAFSVSHCAVVKVVKGSDVYTTTFSHTAALQFLPSLFAESPCTPGITALARLARRIDPALFVRVSQIWRGHKKKDMRRIDHQKSFAPEGTIDAPPSVSCAALPLELWQEIALHLDLQDVLTLGLVSKLCRESASMVLRYPHVRGYRLVAVSNDPPPKDLLQRSRILQSASFYATRAGIPATVFLGEREVTLKTMGLALHSWGTVSLPLHTKRYREYLPIPVSGTVQPDRAWGVRKAWQHRY
ncbi:hypothetical protein EDB19DRAFT_1027162 [Suillus lakei]|nr:hypothetical protein EDB19DRAFT_1027162 [Suillus lakei]